MENRSKTGGEIGLVLTEWAKATPLTHPVLAGFSFADEPAADQTARRLTETGQLTLHQFASGLEIQTSSVVGTIQLGRLSLTVTPKIDTLPLMRLLRFAYGLRELDTYKLKSLASQKLAFQDLLIYQLVMEVEELVSRGLLKQYVRKSENLVSPVGRLDFQKFTSQGGLLGGALPCLYHHRLEDCLHNRFLLSGLRLAAFLTADLTLRSCASQLIGLLSESIQPIPLNREAVSQVECASNRLNETYNPAIKLITLLMSHSGSGLDEDRDPVKQHGFLFDMNRFFQAFISRLLAKYLEGYQVKDEHALKGFLSYIPGFELPNRQDPLPRPDFALFQNGSLVTLLDAKYRDLWQEGLPRDMLYQLIVYALSQSINRQATILYPTLHDTARVSKLQINEPMMGCAQGAVILRPVPITHIDRLLNERKECELKSLVTKTVFG